ncbi:membrane protein DedA with SNARE-associated domain [Nocardioides marinisabuli]|uniref:Membrane protein DedA with SNARE-associated domain n=1 Tax=Nocardioides marinisabuli TaxID=419476 RepID=A0A7Y9EZ25_9ACTN|nr:DedA family protein [Nocardioides marinisabuli]NYD56622.1 membrane protein DedA with SNARE-associated domain [Nocardioides marinisabuli]
MSSADGWSVLLAGLLAFAESALGVGAFFPGEVAITAVVAGLDRASQGAAVLVLALGATAGDHVGYLLGRRFGPRLAGSRLVRRVGVDRWATATRLVQRRGAPAVFVSRLLPLVRTVMPAVAGVAGMRYAWFAAASVSGSLVWAMVWVTAGGAVRALGALAGPAGLLLLVSAVGAAGLVRWVLRRRAARATARA